MICNKNVSTLIATVFLSLLAFAAQAGSLDKIHFIKIAPQDGKAIIKGADGKLQVIKQGDVVVEGVTVKEIVPGRIILEEKSDKGVDTIIVRLDNGKQRIERLRKQAEVRPALAAPATKQKP